MRKKTGKILSLVMIIILSSFLFSSSLFVLADDKIPDEKMSTTVAFVTDDPIEYNSFLSIENDVKDIKISSEHKFSGAGFEQFGKKLESYRVCNSDSTDYETSETIIYNYDLLSKNSVYKKALNLIENGKTVLFYGNKIDLAEFCKMFGLEDCYDPHNSYAEKEKGGGDATISSSVLVAIGVEQSKYGNVLIKIEDDSYDFYRVIDSSIANAIHSKELKMKPMNNQLYNSTQNLGLLDRIFSGEQVSAAGFEAYTPINYQRNTASGFLFYTLITDAYLYRITDTDQTYDYFMLETKSELIQAGNPPKPQIRTRLTGFYASDVARAGGPASQGPITNQTITVAFTPPSISYSFSTGVDEQIYGTLSQLNRYYENTNVCSNPYGFTNTTHHTTELSYLCYAPTSGLTFTKVSIVQKLGDGIFWTNYFNPWNFYYNY